MRRWSIYIFGITFGAALALAQEPTHPGQLFSSDLVAWSFMQQPQQPEQSHSKQPEPTPETQPAQNPTPAQPDQRQTGPSAQESDQAATLQTFTGTISKQSDSYFLKVSDSSSYKLDNQSRVQPYEGRRVQITGTLDRSINLIHVNKVEPIS